MRSLHPPRSDAFRTAVGLTLLCACACSAPPPTQPENALHTPPNIVLISLDACRADHLGCYGYPRDTSPFIDSLAAQGTVFKNAFVNTHGTAPSHTTMLTSLYQETHGISLITPKPGEADRVPAGALMVQEVLRGHGYLTLGVTGGGFMGSALAFDRGFVELDDRPGRIPTQTRRLVRLVERYSDVQQPLFLLLHTYETHSPYRAPPEYAELFDSSTSNFEPTTKNLLASVNTADRDLTADDIERLKALYDAEIRYTDDTLRALFSQLEDSGFLDNALVIITADHGEELAEHGGLLHRGLLYEELVHVPLIIWKSGSHSGAIDERLVSTIDITPTILAAAGVAAPAEMNGRILLSRDATEAGRDWDTVFMQYSNLRYGIRTRQWKLIETVKSGKTELYDLLRDPQEKSNVAQTSEAVVSELRERLSEWRASQSQRHIAPTAVDLSAKDKAQLEALGYVDGQNPDASQP